MRTVLGLLLVVCAGCSDQSSQWSYPPIQDPGGGGFCTDDSQCGGDVCAHNDQCYPASQLRQVHALWTVNGAPPDGVACDHHADLELSFIADLGIGAGDTDITFAPVPCVEGKFSIDKLPMAYTSIALASQDGGFASAAIDDATGNAMVDLTFH